MPIEFDFIIAGAGSAGCVLADKLSASGEYSVALVETGSSDKKFWIQTPIGYGITYTDPKVNWCFTAAPDSALKNRSLYWPRGKVLGGSSSINALVYHRGQMQDYDDWALATNTSWNYKNAEKIYESFEERLEPNSVVQSNHNIPEPVNKLSVFNASADYHNLKHDFQDAFSELNLTSSSQGFFAGEGLGPYWLTTRNGKRCSSASAFLHPAASRPNLYILTETSATKINIRNKRAVGIEVTGKNKKRTLKARREVIVAAGAVNSPQLLQLSGIGGSHHLNTLGIKPIVEHPHVGQHLQDHLGINYFFKSKKPTLNNTLGSWPGRLRSGIQYIARRRGPLSLSVNQVGGLVRADPQTAHVDTQLYCNPVSYQPADTYARKLTQPDSYPGFIMGFNPCRPTSEGAITVRSNNPNDAPEIRTNYLSTEHDLNSIVGMAKLIGKIQDTQAIQNILSEAPD
ncbi:MAG: choline dehydrogenase, partial [Proteobacteria bacterium]|nr:choline dehydrogenase [Pseudomonadota bacterium]